MLKSIAITGYKSVDDLKIELGRTNVLIGENGCGKTNVLEAIAFGAAAANAHLENDYLISRGIRLASPERMISGFGRSSRDLSFGIDVSLGDERTLAFHLLHSGGNYPRWQKRLWTDLWGPGYAELVRQELTRQSGLDSKIAALLSDPRASRSIIDYMNQFQEQVDSDPEFGSFLTYTPHEEALRDLSRESHIEPIGIHGEGLYRLLESLSPDRFALVKEQLALIQWFEDLEFTPGQNPAARSLKIVDQHLGEGLRDFDQRSANEGFLFVLLYACLLISKDTPRFFAVDNVDTALNPKLCAGVVRMFAELTRSQDRQVILTAHNPGALDGLDLRDDAQRLFVVYRNVEGRTRVRRIDASILEGQERPLRLSEAFLRGYLGGLPEHF